MFSRGREPYRRTVNSQTVLTASLVERREKLLHLLRCSLHHHKRDCSNSCFQSSSLVYRHRCSPMSFSPPQAWSSLCWSLSLSCGHAAACTSAVIHIHHGAEEAQRSTPSRATPLLLGSVLTADNGNIPAGRQGSSEVVKVMFRLSIWYSDRSRCVYR